MFTNTPYICQIYRMYNIFLLKPKVRYSICLIYIYAYCACDIYICVCVYLCVHNELSEYMPDELSEMSEYMSDTLPETSEYMPDEWTEKIPHIMPYDLTEQSITMIITRSK